MCVCVSACESCELCVWGPATPILGELRMYIYFRKSRAGGGGGGISGHTPIAHTYVKCGADSVCFWSRAHASVEHHAALLPRCTPVLRPDEPLLHSSGTPWHRVRGDLHSSGHGVGTGTQAGPGQILFVPMIEAGHGIQWGQAGIARAP